jgi:hypothetical protein
MARNFIIMPGIIKDPMQRAESFRGMIEHLYFQMHPVRCSRSEPRWELPPDPQQVQVKDIRSMENSLNTPPIAPGDVCAPESSEILDCKTEWRKCSQRNATILQKRKICPICNQPHQL